MAETGHLVFGTLHTTDAAQTINRIIDIFPPHQQTQIRSQLSFVLRSVVAQQLIPMAAGKGRIVCNEILIGNPAVANCIREQKISGLYTVMQTSNDEGMMTFEMCLRDLYLRGDITLEEAMSHTMHPKELERMLKSA
jgi:twitching motility protein PilT